MSFTSSMVAGSDEKAEPTEAQKALRWRYLSLRDPDGKILPAGPYRLRLVAVPTSGGPATTRTITFRVK